MSIAISKTTPKVVEWNMPLLALPFASNAGAAWTIQWNATINAYIVYNGNNVANDYGIWRHALSSGIWTLAYLMASDTNRGIMAVDLSYDGGVTWTNVTNIDSYAATPGLKQGRSSGIIIATDEMILVRLQSRGANGASVGAFIASSSLIWTKTSA